MARVPAWTLGSYVWGDKTLQALQYADDANTHVHPQAQDIDINSLIADYLSLTAGNQRVAPTITITDDPASGKANFELLDTGRLRGWQFWGPNFSSSPIISAVLQNNDVVFGTFLVLQQITGAASGQFIAGANAIGFDTVDGIAGHGRLKIGDDTSIAAVAWAGIDFLSPLGVSTTPASLSGLTSSAGTNSKQPSWADHIHGVTKNTIASNIKPDGLAAAAGSLDTIPKTDHIHKGIVNVVDGRSTAQTGAIASLFTFTVGAADGLFRIQGNVNITTFVAGTFNMTVAYTDETNTARTLTLNFSTLTGTLGIALAAAGPFEGIPSVIRCKASTTITTATSGTFTSLTYNAEAMLEQLA